MPARETVVVCVHGANQAKKDEQENRRTWETSFELERECRIVRDIINGEMNDDIDTYHSTKHVGTDFPQYVGWHAAWYGDIWQRLLQLPEGDPFSDSLSRSWDGENDERLYLLEIVERAAMKKHFDELVPFYELAVCRDSGRTMYEEICAKLLHDIKNATDNGQKDFVLLGHSMGCCVSYNLLSHMDRVANGLAPAAFNGALSNQYHEEIQAFLNQPGKPFGLLTFGNYMGYNWAQKANTRILYDTYEKHYVYPDICPRWYNFFTMFGSDPYIIDDLLEQTIVSDEDDSYDDVRVRTYPLINIGHGRHNWFRWDSFTNGLRKKFTKHLYR